MKIKILNKEQQSNERVSQDKESFKTRNTPMTFTHYITIFYSIYFLKTFH